MKRKPKRVVWDVERDDWGYWIDSPRFPTRVWRNSWRALGFPALRPGQIAKVTVTIEGVEVVND